MALQQIIEPFLWGSGGRKMTPDDIAREREIAAALGEVDTSPVGHWLEGAARMANAATGRIREGRANRAEAQNREELAGIRTAALGSLLGGQGDSNPVAAALAGGGDTIERAPLAPPMDPASARVAQAHATSSGLPSVDEMSAYIAEVAPSYGIDPEIALRVARSEGLAPGVWQSNVQDDRRGREPSYGPFQLLVGGEGGWPGGMGNDFIQQTGLDPSDPANWRETVNFALSNASQGGWSPWYGAAHVGVGNWDGIQRGQAPSQAALESMAVGESMPMPSGDVASALAGPQQQPVQTAQAGGINPAIIELLSHPAASAGDRQIAELLIGQHMQAQQAERDRMLAEQQMQQRMQAAQAAGIDPRFIGDDEIWKAGVGQQFQDPTTDIQEYEYARAQGFPGSFTDFQIAKRQAGGVNVNIGDGAPGLGKLSSDYGYVLDPDTGQPVIDPMTGLPQAAPIPGSPAAQSIEDAERQREAARTNAANYARTVTQDIGIADDYLGQIEGMAADDGVIGANLRNTRASIPGTPENNMKAFVDSALSNVTLDTMNRMRESSPAGATGFGNMSERQMEVIRGVLGNWKPTLPVEDQRMILHRLGNFYLDVQFGSQQERQEAVRDGLMSQIENDAIQELYYPETRDVRGRRANEGAPAQINSEQDYIDLPSGAEFIAPDGSVRRKP